MKWISTDGEPYVFIPKEKMKNWSGINASTTGSNKDIVKLDLINFGKSDYEQACMLEGDLAVLLFEDTQILVFPGESDITQIEDKYVVALIQGEDLSSKLNKDEIDKIHHWDYSLTIELGYQDYVIFGAAIPGEEVKEVERLMFNLKRGFYQVSVKTYESDDESRFKIYRFNKNIVPF